MGFNKELMFAVCVSGIYFFYLLFGIMQEKVNKGKFGPEAERFKSTLFLIFVQCFVTAIVALVGIVGLRFGSDATPKYKYAYIASSYMGAMVCSNLALQYIDYPTQVLAKSVKPIPVMLTGLVLLHKSYPLSKYVSVVMITIGISLFMYKGSHDSGTETSLWGFVLCLVSLGLDGMTGPYQEKVIHAHKPTSLHMMYYSNVWSTLFLGVALLVTDQFWVATSFCTRHPEIILDIFLFALSSALGQIFIYLTIHTFDSLVCSTVTTTRKFFTILASVVWFGHPLSNQQWIAVGLVFGGLGLDTLSGYFRRRAPRPHTE